MLKTFYKTQPVKICQICACRFLINLQLGVLLYGRKRHTPNYVKCEKYRLVSNYLSRPYRRQIAISSAISMPVMPSPRQDVIETSHCQHGLMILVSPDNCLDFNRSITVPFKRVHAYKVYGKKKRKEQYPHKASFKFDISICTIKGYFEHNHRLLLFTQLDCIYYHNDANVHSFRRQIQY